MPDCKYPHSNEVTTPPKSPQPPDSTHSHSCYTAPANYCPRLARFREDIWASCLPRRLSGSRSVAFRFLESCVSTFADVYQRLCERYPDERDRGRAFEPLVQKVLLTAPMYRERFAEVYRWDEWPGRDGGDIGIDIVAQRHDGGLVAIQCKCQDRIEKHTIDSFLADSQRRLNGEPYVERYVFTTATEWSDNAERALTRIDPPVQRVDFFGLDGLAIDWDTYLEDETSPLQKKARKQLRSPPARRAQQCAFRV